jgi:diketogulonate reductase-like aldo/keto reductase
MEYPLIGLGTYKLRSQESVNNALTYAFSNDYKMIDCAEIYKNQKLIGNYLKENNIDRTSIWITSKVSFVNMKKNMEQVIKGIDQTFADLNTDYIDLYLIHAPIEDTLIETWNFLLKLQSEGKIRFVGLSNFTLVKLQKFIEKIGEESRHIFCNQIEYNPFLNRKDLIDYCQGINIKVIAYGSLYKYNDEIIRIANIYKKSPQQILLKWALQKKIHVIPMSETLEFTRDNIRLFDFAIDNDYVKIMDNLNENYSLYPKYL